MLWATSETLSTFQLTCPWLEQEDVCPQAWTELSRCQHQHWACVTFGSTNPPLVQLSQRAGSSAKSCARPNTASTTGDWACTLWVLLAMTLYQGLQLARTQTGTTCPTKLPADHVGWKQLSLQRINEANTRPVPNQLFKLLGGLAKNLMQKLKCKVDLVWWGKNGLQCPLLVARQDVV